MTAPLHHRFRDTLAAYFERGGVPVKSLFVGPSGTITVTLYGEESARKVADLIEPFAKVRAISPGHDAGSATEIVSGVRRGVRVWRVHAFAAA